MGLSLSLPFHDESQLKEGENHEKQVERHEDVINIVYDFTGHVPKRM